jgi:hypothetical protein
MLGGERGSCRRRSPIPPPGAGQLALPMPDPEEAARLRRVGGRRVGRGRGASTGRCGIGSWLAASPQCRIRSKSVSRAAQSELTEAASRPAARRPRTPHRAVLSALPRRVLGGIASPRGSASVLALSPKSTATVVGSDCLYAWRYPKIDGNCRRIRLSLRGTISFRLPPRSSSQ